MKITVDVNALSGALNTVTRALTARPVSEIMNYVLLEASDGELVLTCTDGNFAIESRIPAQVEETGRAAYNGRFMADVIRKLPGGEVTLTSDASLAVRIRSGAVRTSLAGMDPVEFPEMAEVEDGQHIQLPQDKLRAMISRVSFAVAADESRQILTGMLMEIRPGSLRLVALDGFRLAMQSSSAQTSVTGAEPVHLICPGRVMNELSRILPESQEDCDICFDRKHMQIRFGSTLLSTVLMAGQYIDYERILPASFATVCRMDRGQLASAIDFASLYAREAKNNLVKMKIETSTLGVSSNAELGDFQQDLQIDQTGPMLQIAFNAKYLSDVLHSISEDEIALKFNSSVQPCVIGPVEEGDYLYLILPVRVFQ